MNEVEVKNKLERIVGDIVGHVRHSRFQNYRVIFATSDDVCWEFLIGDDEEWTDGICLIKWVDGKSANLVTFHTNYCFERFSGMPLEDELEDLKERILCFFDGEI